LELPDQPQLAPGTRDITRRDTRTGTQDGSATSQHRHRLGEPEAIADRGFCPVAGGRPDKLRRDLYGVGLGRDETLRILRGLKQARLILGPGKWRWGRRAPGIAGRRGSRVAADPTPARAAGTAPRRSSAAARPAAAGAVSADRAAGPGSRTRACAGSGKGPSDPDWPARTPRRWVGGDA